MLFLLDILGTFAFAVYGAHLAQEKKFDLFGIFTCAAISALGGGTIRELLLNGMPAYFSNYAYVAAIAVGVAFSIWTFGWFKKIDAYILVLDAVGLVTFAFLGADRAAHAGLGLLGIATFAVLTAVGGGILRDVAVKDVPLVFSRDFYATPALLLGVAYFFLQPHMANPAAVYLLLAVTFALRLLAIRFGLSLWRPKSDIMRPS